MFEILQRSLTRHMNDMQCCSTQEEMLDHILIDLENEGFKLVDEKDQVIQWEPEEGWDAYFAEQDRKERLRDFKIYDTSIRRGSIAQAFLDGKDFEELAEEWNVTIERIRQIVCKARRLYNANNKL